MPNPTPAHSSPESVRRAAGRIAVIYALVALAWIVASDRVLLFLSVEPQALSRLQTWKGGLFVLVTALLLFFLVLRALRRERAGEQRYRSMFENNHAVMLLSDPDDGAVVDANPAACKFYGYDRDHWQQLRISDINTLGPAQIAAEMAHARALNRNSFELSHRLADGTERDVEVYTGPVSVGSRQLLYSIVHDISARKEAERELKRVNRTLRVLSRVTEVLVRAADEGVLLQGVCDLLVKLGGYQLAWIGNPATGEVAAQSGTGLTCLDTAHYPGNAPDREICPTLEALKSRMPVVIRDISSSDSYSHLRKSVDALGLVGISALPLCVEGESFGALTIYSREENPFDQEEVKLLRELAEDLAFGIAALRNRKARKAIETELRESERYNRALFEQSPIGLALCRMDGQLVDVNPAFARILGRTVEETLALTYWDITPKCYLPEERKQLDSLEKTGSYGPFVKEYRHREGHLIPVRLQGRLIERGRQRFIWSMVEELSPHPGKKPDP